MEKVKEHIKRNVSLYIALGISLVLAILSYVWKPSEEYDLYQYYTWLNKLQFFKGKDIIDFFIYRGEPLIMGYFYIIAQIGNFQLLQVIPTFLFFFIGLFILIDYSKKKNVSKYITMLVGLFWFSLYKYVLVVSSFRYSLAYMVFVLALYFDYIKNKDKRLVLILYIIPCLIHTSSFILIALRIFNNIKNKKIVFGIICSITILLVFPEVITLCVGVISNGLLSNIADKIYIYFGRREFNISLQYFFRVFQTLFMILLSVYYDYKNKEDKFNSEYNRYLYIISIFTVLCIPYYSAFLRFNDLLLLIMLPKMLITLNNIKKQRDKKIIYFICLIFIIAGIRIQIPVWEKMYFI